MKICFISQEYPPETHVGGIGTYTYNMAHALVRLGHTVHVISATNNESRIVDDEGVQVHRLKKWNIEPSELSRLIHSYFVSKKISNIKCSFDIVHASEFGNEAFWFSFKKKYPLVTRLATPFYLVKKLNSKAFFGPRPLLDFMEKTQTLKSDGIFSSTKALAKEVSRQWGINPSFIEIIPNSIDLDRVKRLGQSGIIPDELNKKDFIVYFGRLEERKGVDVLARALPAVLKQLPTFYMVFIGSDLGYHRTSMRQYIRETVGEHEGRVIFFENQPHEKLFPIIKSAKIAVLPSTWEAFGFVAVEAMTLGCPVIATSGSGFNEIIENNVSGHLVDPGNSEQLEKILINVLENQDHLRQISKGSVERASHFEVSEIAQKLIRYYRTILDSGN